MSEVKFTPGPYLVDDETVYAVSARGTNRMSASVQAGFDDDGKRASFEELCATANLLGAALLMFEALRQLVVEIDGDSGIRRRLHVGSPGEHQALLDARNAMASAMGATRPHPTGEA